MSVTTPVSWDILGTTEQLDSRRKLDFLATSEVA